MSENATVIAHPELNVALPNIATGLQSVATEGLVVHLVRCVLQVLQIAPNDKMRPTQHTYVRNFHQD